MMLAERLSEIPETYTGRLLEGRVAMVTGAGSRLGLGRAIARLFAAHGARVAVTDRDGDSAVALAKELGAGHFGFACDIADPQQCDRAWQVAESTLGPVDVLVNNAGYGTRRPTVEISAEEFDQMLKVNTYGTFFMTKAALRSMTKRRSGNIIYVSSMAAQRGGGTYGASHYVAAKAAAAAFTIAMAREYGPLGIRANVVAPNLIDNGASRDMTREQRQELESQVPLRRSGSQWDAAGAALFLASDLSSYCNGATVDVNGAFNTR